VRLLAVDEETADFFALIFNQLKVQGRPIPTNDIWIAASAMRHGLALATFDNHFAHISGLNLQIIVNEVQP
jgi:predicted nucleic acid-binding protein